MALSLKTISVGSETGVQDIQSNFTTIKSAVDALQNSVSEIKLVRDFTCMNGINNGTAGNKDNLILLNYPTYQILWASVWLNNLNLNAWQSKQGVSIPKSYFKFNKCIFISGAPGEQMENGACLSADLDVSTGIVTFGTRSKSVSATRWMGQYIIYNQ